MMSDVNVRTSFIEVNRTSLFKNIRKERIKTIEFKTNPMYISLKLGKTIAQPANSWAKAEVMLSMPCYVDELADVYNEVKTKVVELLQEQVDDIERENEAIKKKLNY